MYGFTINSTQKLSERGLSIVILTETDDIVEGVKLFANGNANFSLTKKELSDLISTKELVFIEKLPKFVVKVMQETHKNNNLKHSAQVI